MRSNPPKGDPSSIRRWVVPVLFGTAVSLMGTAAVLMIFALVLTLQDIPQGMILPLAVGAMGIGTCLGGYVSARIVGKKGILCGLLTGLLCCLILTGVSLAVIHSWMDASQAVKLGVVLTMSCIGGVLGVNRQGKRRA